MCFLIALTLHLLMYILYGHQKLNINCCDCTTLQKGNVKVIWQKIPAQSEDESQSMDDCFHESFILFILFYHCVWTHKAKYFPPAIWFAFHYSDKCNIPKTHTYIHKHGCTQKDFEHILAASICQGASASRGKRAMFMASCPFWDWDEYQTVRREGGQAKLIFWMLFRGITHEDIRLHYHLIGL